MRPSHNTNWRVPYKDWTAIDLTVANFLRPVPLPTRDLCLYAGHRLKSFENARNTLREDGSLTPDNQILLDHLRFRQLAGTPKALPLPDPGLRPPTRQHTATVHQAAQLVADTPSAPLDRKTAAATLSNWITTGAAGKDTPRFIDSWLSLIGTAAGAGPSEPKLATEIHDRLLRLLSACPETAVRNVITAWEAHIADPLHAGTAPPRHVEDGQAPPPEAEDLLRPRNL